MHACNPSTLGRRGRRISEFEASLVYRVSSRTARAIQRNPVSKKTKSKKKKKCSSGSWCWETGNTKSTVKHLLGIWPDVWSMRLPTSFSPLLDQCFIVCRYVYICMCVHEHGGTCIRRPEATLRCDSSGASPWFLQAGFLIGTWRSLLSLTAGPQVHPFLPSAGITSMHYAGLFVCLVLETGHGCPGLHMQMRLASTQ